MELTNIITKHSNTLGIVSSGLCIIHCLSLPIFYLTSGFASAFYVGEQDYFHYCFFLLSLIMVYVSTRQSKKELQYFMWFVGGVFSITLLLHEVYDHMIYISLLSSFVLIILHLINQKQRKKMALERDLSSKK